MLSGNGNSSPAVLCRVRMPPSNSKSDTATRGDSRSMIVMALPLAEENVSGVSSAIVCGPGTATWMGSSIGWTVSETVASVLRPPASVAR